METRKTIAIFSSCQRPTSPGNGCLLLPLFGFLQKKMLTYHGDNLILSRSRLLLQPLFLIHLRVGAHSEVKTLTFFRNANPPIELLPKGPLLGNYQALSKCQNLSLISLLYHQIPLVHYFHQDCSFHLVKTIFTNFTMYLILGMFLSTV